MSDVSCLRCSSWSSRRADSRRAWTVETERRRRSRLVCPATRSRQCPLCSRLYTRTLTFLPRDATLYALRYMSYGPAFVRLSIRNEPVLYRQGCFRAQGLPSDYPNFLRISPKTRCMAKPSVSPLPARHSVILDFKLVPLHNTCQSLPSVCYITFMQ